VTPKTKLDRLLDLRRDEEERRALELAMASQAMADADEALRRLREQRGEVERALGRLEGERVGEVLTLRLLIEQLDRSIQNALTVRTLAAATVVEKQEAFTEAQRRTDSLERIVIPRIEHARALERLAERKHEDEVALTPYRLGGMGPQ